MVRPIVRSPDALLMQTRAESRGCFVWLLFLYILGAVLVGNQLRVTELPPRRWQHTVDGDSETSAMDFTLISSRVSPRVDVRLQVHAEGTALARLLLERTVRIEVFRGRTPDLNLDVRGCPLPDLAVFLPNGSALQPISSHLVPDAVAADEASVRATPPHGSLPGPTMPPSAPSTPPSRPPPNTPVCSELNPSPLLTESCTRVLDESRRQLLRCPLGTSSCEPLMLLQLDASPGYTYRIRLTLERLAPFGSPELTAPALPTNRSLGASAAVRAASTANGAPRVENVTWWSGGHDELSMGDITSASIELSAPTKLSRIREIGLRLAMMLLTFAVRWWYREQISDFLSADKLPTQTCVSLVALCVALQDEPFSDMLTLIRGGHNLAEIFRVSRLVLAYLPLLCFALVCVETARLHKRPALVGFWLPKLLLLVSLVLPVFVAWPLRTPTTLISRLDTTMEVPYASRDRVQTLAYWLEPVRYDSLRRPLDSGGLKDELLAVLCFEAIALGAYAVTLLLSLAAYLFDDDVLGRRNQSQPMWIAFLTIGITVGMLRNDLDEALSFQAQPQVPRNLCLWLLNSMMWFLLIGVSPAHSMRELIGTSRLRERAELWLRQSGQPSGGHASTRAMPLLNDLSASTPEHKVPRIGQFLEGFSLHRAASESLDGSSPRGSAAEHSTDLAPRSGKRPAREPSMSMDSLQHGEIGRGRKGSIQTGVASYEYEWAGPHGAPEQANAAPWLRQHMSCVINFLPSWRLATIYVVLYGLLFLITVLTFAGSSNLESSVISIDTYVNVTGCGDPLLHFDASRCSGVDAIGGAEMRVDVAGERDAT